jgi:imidazolonepropionase
VAERLTLWRNARLATCDGAMRVIERGAILTRGGRIEWIGEESALPADTMARPAPEAAPADDPGEHRRGRGMHSHEPNAVAEVHDLEGAWVTPGLIDCHTHLVFAGTRATEYAERLRGLSYEEIARRGGGILATMRAVRGASEQQLFDESAPRLTALISEGVTTVEIKSGYGLTLADETKMLRVARSLERAFPITVKTTLLAAHTVPPEYRGRPDEYIRLVCTEWLPALHAEGLIDAVDVFCETIGFNLSQTQQLFEAAQARGIPIKMHAEQLSNFGASQLGARHGALSCDHLEHATVADARALAAAGTAAVLLPVAFYCLAAERRPPIDALREAGAGMAVASDCNPGSAPGTSLLLAMSMATRLFGLTAQEVLAGVTRQAARALGEQGRRGTLEVGRVADFVIWRVRDIEELGYWIGFNPCGAVVRNGGVTV